MAGQPGFDRHDLCGSIRFTLVRAVLALERYRQPLSLVPSGQSRWDSLDEEPFELANSAVPLMRSMV